MIQEGCAGNIQQDSACHFQKRRLTEQISPPRQDGNAQENQIAVHSARYLSPGPFRRSRLAEKLPIIIASIGWWRLTIRLMAKDCGGWLNGRLFEHRSDGLYELDQMGVESVPEDA